jgi:microcystin-dependent protein
MATSTTSNITFYDSSTATIQALQFRSRCFTLAPTIANDDYVVDFMKGADIAYAENGTVDWTNSTFEIPDMTYDRPVIDDYGRHFIYEGIYQATLQNDGVVQARQMYDAYTHTIGIDYLQAHSNLVSSNIVSSNITTSNVTVYDNLNVIGNIYGNGQYITGLTSSQWTTIGNNIFYTIGNIGVGTTNPSQKLDVNGTVKATTFQGDGSLLTGLPVTSSQWSTTGTTVYYNGGSVGIGTSSTGSLKLRVNGNTSINGTLGVDSLTSLYGGVSIQNNSDLYGSFTINSLNTTASLSLTGANTYNENISFFTKSALSRNTAYGDTLLINGSSHFSAVSLSGNIGIGTTNPSQKLDVNGTVNATKYIGDGVVPAGTIIHCVGRFAPSGYIFCNGEYRLRSAYTDLFNAIVPIKGTVTLTIANPCVAKFNNHGLMNNDPISFETTGTLPSPIGGITPTVYPFIRETFYAINVTTNTFQIANTSNGTAISTVGGAQSGTHTVFNCPFRIGIDTGGDTFYLPDFRGMFLRGWDNNGSIDPNRNWGTYQADALKTHTHTYDKSGERSGVTGGGNQNAGNAVYTSTNSGNPSTGTAPETRPMNYALLTCIKT